ncbi:hypothetical protein R1flu_013451 [Riccia fluitans]|uniref:SP-RING-type domain-containing protein n=1 Tax=Riccia fluitans TaxID=41844 RepID=A0ABD1YE14_9MARC
MAVKEEFESPISERLKSEKCESGEIFTWSTPLKFTIPKVEKDRWIDADENQSGTNLKASSPKREKDRSIDTEKNQWSTPLKSSSPKGEKGRWIDAVKAPVKAKRKLVSDVTEEEQCGFNLLQTPKSVLNCTDHTLRCCPDFESLFHAANGNNRAVCVERNGRGLDCSLPIVDGGQSLRSDSANSLNSNEKIGEVVGESKCRNRVDFSGGELAVDLEDMDDDTCITGSKYGIINTRCPLSGKLVTELGDPVQSVKCQHVYGKEFAEVYLKQAKGISRCAVAGCCEVLTESDFTSATSLTDSIRELGEKSSANRLKLLMECIHLDDD